MRPVKHVIALVSQTISNLGISREVGEVETFLCIARPTLDSRKYIVLVLIALFNDRQLGHLRWWLFILGLRHTIHEYPCPFSVDVARTLCPLGFGFLFTFNANPCPLFSTCVFAWCLSAERHPPLKHVRQTSMP